MVNGEGITLGIEEQNYLVNLSWVVTEDVLLYAQFSDGFRNGGFPARTPPGTGLAFEDVIYGPEFVDSYEVGVKGTWLDGKLRTNAAIFLADYSDQQINATIFDPGLGGNVGTILNLGESTISAVSYTHLTLPTKA